jgi:hypothetical protein
MKHPSSDPEPPGSTPHLEPVLGDLVRRFIHKVVDRGRTELGRAARTGRSQLELRQLQKDLDHFWVRLGKTTARLVEGGEIDHPALRKAIQRIDELEARIDELRRSSREPPER